MGLWDLKAGVYDALRRLPGLKRLYEGELTSLEALLPSCGFAKQLDVGTGTGSSLRLFSRSSQLVLSDFSRQMVRIARRRTGWPAVVLDAGQPLPFKDSTFDLISAIGLVEYVREIEGLLGELRRIATPGGWMLLTSTPPGFATTLRGASGARPIARTAPEMRRLLAAAGWRVMASRRTFMQEQMLCCIDER